MASYPDYIQIIDDARNTSRQSRELMMTELNTPVVHSFHTDHDPDFVRSHDVDKTGRDVLLTFYTTNHAITFTFTDHADSAVHTCRFTAKPDVRNLGAGRFLVTNRFAKART